MNDLSSFVDGVERLEVEELDAGASTARFTKSTYNGSVDDVLVSARDAYATRRITSSGRKVA